jgi:ubiquinone/menaquinone biosynthesis C-methylase UbiE
MRAPLSIDPFVHGGSLHRHGVQAIGQAFAPALARDSLPDVSIHRVAATGFDLGAQTYERGRPGYPQEAVDALIRDLRMGSRTNVVELGAGTGKLTRMLAPTGAWIVAVEPVEGMRREFRRLLPDVPILAGTAEAIPLGEVSVDAAVVAQAFHWFDGPAALAELHRVLRPRAGLAVVWNVRDESHELARAMTEFFDRYRRGVPQHRDKLWQRAFEETELFSPLETRSFPHEQRLDLDGLRDRAMSVSFMASLSPEEQQRAREELLAMVADLGDEIVLPYRTDVHRCERL